MSEARALTNLIGNGVATVVVGKWTKELDTRRMSAVLNNDAATFPEHPEQAVASSSR